jgi:diguanylate cyclase (GGDEF)-like protein/PAS domain S-box-containing protein
VGVRHDDDQPRRTLSPRVLAYAVNPVALATFWLLRGADLIADEPLWAYLLVLWGGGGVATAADAWFRRRPGVVSLHARVAAQTACVGSTIYVTGWGPALTLMYAFMAQENAARTGATTWRITALWSVLSIAAGQLAIVHGWAPSLLDERLVHGLAVVSALGVVMVIRMAGAVTAEKERAEASMRHSEERFRSLVQNSSDLTFIVDPEGRISYVSEASRRLLGAAPKDLVGIESATLVHPSDLDLLRSRLRVEFADADVARPIEVRLRTADGGWNHFEVVLANLVDRPAVGGIVVNARDITERKRAEAALEHQALHDSLTELPNRVLFLDRLEQAIARTERHPSVAPAVIFMDLDRFKLVNDGLGHEAGDELLAAVATRLRAALRPSDTVARFGGDEFVLLCEGVATTGTAEAIGARVLSCFDEPFELAGEQFQVSASVGIALFERAATAGELLRHADEAMYRAKAMGRGCYQIFDATAREEALLRMHTETALRRALDANELRLHYQPIFDLATMRPSGVEALLRWEHPTGGLLGPSAFMAVAEESGLIVPIGEWALREACRQVRDWNSMRAPEDALSLSVNLSARQLTEPGVVAMVRDVLAEECVDTQRLRLALEVTETSMLRDPETAAARLAELRALGVEFAIDDFGTGYSSLNYLRQFPVSIVKIDRGFVAGLGSSPEDEAIVRAIVQLGRTLGLSVIAEGVETEAQLARLKEIGCDQAQGFLLAFPEGAGMLDRDGTLGRSARRATANA